MTKQTPAQIKSKNKYNKANTKTYCLRFNIHTDKDVIEILDSQKSKQGYIKELIRLDILRDNSID